MDTNFDVGPLAIRNLPSYDTARAQRSIENAISANIGWNPDRNRRFAEELLVAFAEAIVEARSKEDQDTLNSLLHFVKEKLADSMKAVNLLEYYAANRAEVELLADDEALFVIGLIDRFGSMTAEQLAEMSGFGNTGLLTICDRLEADQMLFRNLSSTKGHVYELTDSSRAVLVLFKQLVPVKEHAQSNERPSEFKALLSAAARGNQDARNRLVQDMYFELKELAYISDDTREAQTFRAADLMNQAMLRLFGNDRLLPDDRQHFMRLAAQQMRRILIDRARARNAAKRKGLIIPLEDEGEIPLDRSEELVILDEAMQALADLDSEAAKVVELKFFGGYTDEEAASILNISRAKVRRDWTYARAWLHDHISRQ